ncbi:MAG: hypothetical protein JXB13_09440 [Phycisphaerae bacterium]|nr:hypothetical protein [Phycisphaerae bacterium]
MVRAQSLGMVVTGLAGLCAGCLNGASPWTRATPPPSGSDSGPTVAGHPAEPLEPTGPATDGAASSEVQEVERQINQFLDALARYEESQPTTPQDVPSPPPVAPGGESSREPEPPSPGALGVGSPGVNTGLVLEPAATDASAVATPQPAPVAPVIQGVTIHSAPPLAEPESADAQTVGVNTAMEPSSSAESESLDGMIERLRGHIAEHPNDTEAIWRLVLLELARGDDVRIQEHLEGVARETGDAISTTAEVLRTVREALSEPGPASDRALDAIQRLRNHFTRDAELLIPDVALCTRVSTFGVYDEMDPSALVPFRANPVIVYCELRNFHSERTAEDLYRVTLSSRLEVLTADGRSVWTHEEPQIVDRSRQRREDFFLAQRVSLPAELGPGDYVLKVMIEDTTASKATEATHSFRIGPTVVSQAGP